jgi:hypothetical protein
VDNLETSIRAGNNIKGSYQGLFIQDENFHFFTLWGFLRTFDTKSINTSVIDSEVDQIAPKAIHLEVLHLLEGAGKTL